jgi:hypothetical protein
MEMERWRDGEMERWRDGEMEKSMTVVHILHKNKQDIGHTVFPL